MRRSRVTVTLGLCVFLSGAVWAAEPAKEAENSATPEGETESKKPADPKAAARDEAKKLAQEQYEKCLNCYLYGRFRELGAEMKRVRSMMFTLPVGARKDLAYIRKVAPEHRPRWWKSCRKSSNVSFKARIWGRQFMANYEPDNMVGSQRLYLRRRSRTGPVKVTIIVSWRPSWVDNPKAAKGYLAERHEMTRGDVAEAIVWHELGHNYITKFLPSKQVWELLVDHRMLFDHLQEFYADMTTLYHSSPRARLVVMMMRLNELYGYDDAEPHTRAAHAIGSLILANVLANPDKWPSIHFPPEVPEEEVERNTLIYVYENIDPAWTLAEDKAMRDMAKKFIMVNGEKVLRSKGRIRLPNKLSFKIMTGDDHELQPKRDTWVADKLKAIIKSGRADKADEKWDKWVKEKKSRRHKRRIEVFSGYRIWIRD